MASIDHEQIYFTDGVNSLKYVDKIGEGWNLPGGYKVELNRDIEFVSICLPSGEKITDLKWQPVQWSEYYEKQFHRLFWDTKMKLSRKFGKWICKIPTPICFSYKEKKYKEYWGYWEDENIRMYFHKGEGYNSVFIEGENKGEHFSVVALGGYGHHCNPYTHFINRGYGEEFEEKMLAECYEWLIDDELEEGVREIFEHTEKKSKRIWEDLDIDDIKKRFKYISYFSTDWYGKEYVTYEPYYTGGKGRMKLEG